MKTIDWLCSESDDRVGEILGSKPDFPSMVHHRPTTHIELLELPQACVDLLTRLRAAHTNGGAEMACFRMPADPLLDWYTSRNRWVFDGLADALLSHPTVRTWLQQRLKAEDGFSTGLAVESQFLFDARLAQVLFNGGAYHKRAGDGRAEKEAAVAFCDALFQLRYADVSAAVSYQAWTPWFHGIAWDLTFLLIDTQTRQFWLLAVTDID